MGATRKTRSRVEDLGVQDLVDQLFEANATYEQISKAIEEQTGQRISDSALSRYRQRWSDARARLQQVQHEVEAIMGVLGAKPDANFKDAAMGLFWSKLLRRMAEADATFDRADMVELGHLLVKAVRLNQNTDALQLQRERLDLLKQKITTTAEKVEALGRAKNLDEETLRKIREEIYGLAPAA
ncbi:phage protein Gp27 family protein [Candidatus Nitrospira bockiana]